MFRRERTPMRRIRCCDQLVRGHDTAAVLASSVRKWRRFLSNMGLPPAGRRHTTLQTAALQDFDPAEVRSGSFASDMIVRIQRGTSASPPKRTNGQTSR